METERMDLQRFAEGSAGNGDGAGEGPAEQAEMPEASPVPEERAKKQSAMRNAQGAMKEDPGQDAESASMNRAAEGVGPYEGEGVQEDAREDGPKEGEDVQEDTREDDPYEEESGQEDPQKDTEEHGAHEENSILQRLERLEQELARRDAESMIRTHFDGLQRQAEALKQSFPDFDLQKELGDPVFLRLTSPQVGLSLEDAYYALHHREIDAAGAQAMAEKLGNSVMAGKGLPAENGTVSRESPETGYRPLRELSPEERKLRMDLIRSGKLRFD